MIESNQPKKPIPPGLHGGDRRSAGARSSSQNENLKAFVADIAVKTGKGRSTVARDVTRAKKVAVLDDIAGTCLDKGDEIDALGKLPEGEQRKLATAARAGEKVSAKARKPRQKGADTSVSFRVRFLVLEKFQPDRSEDVGRSFETGAFFCLGFAIWFLFCRHRTVPSRVSPHGALFVCICPHLRWVQFLAQ